MDLLWPRDVSSSGTLSFEMLSLVSSIMLSMVWRRTLLVHNHAHSNLREQFKEEILMLLYMYTQ